MIDLYCMENQIIKNKILNNVQYAWLGLYNVECNILIKSLHSKIILMNFKNIHYYDT